MRSSQSFQASFETVSKIRCPSSPGQGTEVVGVDVGFVDTDLGAGMPGDTVAPQLAATAALLVAHFAVIVKDQFAIVLGQDQIDDGPLEVRVEKQMRVGDDDRVRRNLGVR